MSEQKTPQSQKVDQPIKKLEVRKFYLIHDASETGHPGVIIWKSDDKNLYLAIKFGSSKNDHNILYKRPIGNGIKQSFVYKKAFLGKRKDFYKIPFSDMNLSEEEIAELLKNIDLNDPNYSKNVNRKSKHFFKWAIKNTLYQGQLSDPKVLHDSNNIQKSNSKNKVVNKKNTKS